jgi:hypothetical protein
MHKNVHVVVVTISQINPNPVYPHLSEHLTNSTEINAPFSQAGCVCLLQKGTALYIGIIE